MKKMNFTLILSTLLIVSLLIIDIPTVSAQEQLTPSPLGLVAESGSFVVTSDPQYPWTDKTDAGISENKEVQKERSEQLIRNQYNSINQYASQIDSTVPVIINGDITAFGHDWQWKKMNELFGVLNTPYYYGLGNHDIENNYNDCFRNRCVQYSLENLVKHVESIPHTQFDRKVHHPTASRHTFGSFGYSIDFGPIHSIQLHNYPTYEVHSNGFPRDTYSMSTNLTWLENDLKMAYDNGQTIIVNVHKPNDWKGGPNQQFINLLAKYDVKAVFAGHYHRQLGHQTSYRNYFGNVPVFLSGSASQETYLIVEYDKNNMTVYPVRNNDWRSKDHARAITIPMSQRDSAPTTLELFAEYNGFGQAYISSGAPHSVWNDKIKSVRLPGRTQIQLYEHINFGGKSLTLTNNSDNPKIVNLTSFYDKVSSYRYRNIDNDLWLLNHYNADGWAHLQSEPSNQPNLTNLRNNGGVSAIRLPANSEITIFERTNYSGKSLILTNRSHVPEVYNLNNTIFNNNVLSYRFDRTTYLNNRITSFASQLNQNMVIDQGGGVVLYQFHNGNHQKFLLKYNASRDAYQIWDINSNQILAWNDSGPRNDVFMHRNEDKPEHFWKFDQTVNGSYFIRNYKNNNKVLEIDGGIATNNTQIRVHNYHGGASQQFIMNFH
jgi:Cytolysin, a secreted calcineurin-like phosphatase